MNCGCTATFAGEGYITSGSITLSIDHCAMHESAEQLIWALGLAFDGLDMVDTSCAEFGDEKNCGECSGCLVQLAKEIARRTLATARGEVRA